jgi:uncharacterized protein with GYD domain
MNARIGEDKGKIKFRVLTWQFVPQKGGIDMAMFFMFGKYSSKALKEMSAERTDKAASLIKNFGGEVNSMYALLGEHDLVLIVDFPEAEQVMKASVALTKMTGVSFTSSPAVPVEDFDKMIAEI